VEAVENLCNASLQEGAWRGTDFFFMGKTMLRPDFLTGVSMKQIH